MEEFLHVNVEVLTAASVGFESPFGERINLQGVFEVGEGEVLGGLAGRNLPLGRFGLEMAVEHLDDLVYPIGVLAALLDRGVGPAPQGGALGSSLRGHMPESGVLAAEGADPLSALGTNKFQLTHVINNNEGHPEVLQRGL